MLLKAFWKHISRVKKLLQCFWAPIASHKTGCQRSACLLTGLSFI